MRNQSGAIHCIGIDEAGRGPLAGPVTAAAVVFPVGYKNSRITDSKLLSAEDRESLYGEICRDAIAWACVSVGPKRVDALNIRVATKLAMEFSLKRLVNFLSRLYPQSPPAPRVLIDGNMPISTHLPQETITQGDRQVLVIGAASIVAKVSRDRLMCLLEKRYPGYEFATHKGYGTKVHRERILALGPSPIHRRTFGGVREYYSLALSDSTRGEYASLAEVAVGEGG